MNMSNEAKGNKIDYKSWIIFRSNMGELRKINSWADLGKKFKGNQGWAQKAVQHRSIVTPGDVALSNRLVRELRLKEDEEMNKRKEFEKKMLIGNEKKKVGQLTKAESDNLKEILVALTGKGQKRGRFRVKELAQTFGCTETHISTVKSSGRASKRFYNQVLLFYHGSKEEIDVYDVKEDLSNKSGNNKKWNEVAIEKVRSAIEIIEKEKENQPKSLNKYYGGLIEQLQMVVGELD